MNSPCCPDPLSCPTRRDFLKASSTLAGSAVLVSLALSRVACAQESKGTTPDSAPAKDRYAIRGHHLFDMLGALGTGQSSHKTLGPVAKQIRANT